jgi:DNA repair exonuclease SbcCD ATPase subunit
MKITLKNIFSFENETINFEEGKKYLITGVADQPRNGAGKTNLLQSINYAMSGRVVYTEDSRIISKKQIYRDGKHTPFCELQTNGVTIQRGYKNGGLHTRMSGVDSTRNEEHDNKIAEFFGFPTSSDLSKYIYNFVYIHHHTNSLIGAKDSEKTKTLLSFLELESILTLLSNYRSKKILTKKIIEDYQHHINDSLKLIDVGQLEQQKKTLTDKVNKENILHYSVIPRYERQSHSINAEIETVKRNYAKIEIPLEQPVNTDTLLKQLEGIPTPEQYSKIKTNIKILCNKIKVQNESFLLWEQETNKNLTELMSNSIEGDIDQLEHEKNQLSKKIDLNNIKKADIKKQLQQPFNCPWETCRGEIITVAGGVEKFDSNILEDKLKELQDETTVHKMNETNLNDALIRAKNYKKMIELKADQEKRTLEHESLLSERTETLQDLETQKRKAEKSQDLWRKLEEAKIINKKIKDYTTTLDKLNSDLDKLNFKLKNVKDHIKDATLGKEIHIKIETLSEEIRDARLNNDKYKQSESFKEKVKSLNNKTDYYTFAIRNIPGIISDICTQSVGALQAEMNTILDNMDMGSVRFKLNYNNGLPKDIILECLSNNNWVPFQGVNTAGREAYRVANIVALRKLYYNQIKNFNWLVFDDATPTARDEAEDSIFTGLGQIKGQGVILATACERAGELFQPDEIIRLRMVDNITRIE